MKSDNLTPQHLEWLVNSRTANQCAALKIFTLIDRHPEKCKNKKFLHTTQALIATCFSLWRAAFLADKTGKRLAVLEDARAFLGKILTDNAINYPQDRNSREWTFNYYMSNAKNCLSQLSIDCEEIKPLLSVARKTNKDMSASARRWNRHQKALEIAISHFEKSLISG